ncbi:MAG: hypothetical protein KBA26_01335 [Candidatus Delongbacteria bacterium]|nr:hypothetical protein [Candidatus Delongbacteria bacterium]
MKKQVLFAVSLILMSIVPAVARDYTPMQYCYFIRQQYPQTEKISILIDEDSLESKKRDIERALASFSLQAVVYPVGSSRDLNQVMKKLPDSSLVWVIGSEDLDHTLFLSPFEFICRKGHSGLINHELVRDYAQNQDRHSEYEHASK